MGGESASLETYAAVFARMLPSVHAPSGAVRHVIGSGKSARQRQSANLGQLRIKPIPTAAPFRRFRQPAPEAPRVDSETTAYLSLATTTRSSRHRIGIPYDFRGPK